MRSNRLGLNQNLRRINNMASEDHDEKQDNVLSRTFLCSAKSSNRKLLDLEKSLQDFNEARSRAQLAHTERQ